MDRLTQQKQWFDGIDLSQEYGYKHIYDRLAQYENIGLTPAEIEKLKAENAKLKARLEKSVELPCKVGDRVYILDYKCGKEWLENINFGFCAIGGYDKTEVCCKVLKVREVVVENPFEIPDKFYVTKSEAEQALKEMKGK